MLRNSKSNTLSLSLLLLMVAMLTVAGCAPASTVCTGGDSHSGSPDDPGRPRHF